MSEVSFEATNQGSFTLGDLTGELIGTLTSDLHTELSLSPPPHLENTHTPGQVRHTDTHTRWLFSCVLIFMLISVCVCVQVLLVRTSNSHTGKKHTCL